MSHTCRALLMHCMDFRLGPAIEQYMEEQGFLGDADLVSIAGAAKNIVDPASREFALKQIEISKRLHGISEVHLMNHTDCGAYGGKPVFGSEDEERRKLVADLEEAKAIVNERWPGLKVVLWLAKIREEGDERTVDFENIA